MPDDTDRLTSSDGEPMDEQGCLAPEPLEEQDSSDLAENPFDEIRPTLVRVADKVLRDLDEARDLVGDFETKYLESPDRLGYTSLKGSFEKWTKASVRNNALTLLTKMANRSRLLDEQAERVASASIARLSLEEELHLKRAVDKLLDSLDEESRAVITMFYIGDLSVAEIAAELGKPPVRGSRGHSARGMLARRYQALRSTLRKLRAPYRPRQ